MSSILKQLNVSEIMSINVHKISPDNTVAQAYGLMRAKRIGGLPVVENGNLVGIVTRKDVNGVQFEKRRKTKVGYVMTKEVITVFPDEKVSTALEKITESRIQGMPVISKTGALVGFLTLRDIDKASQTLRNRTLNAPKSNNCSFCGGSLPLTLNRVVICEHCGRTVRF